ncbi:TPA: NusA-like transcription termination signal-binding factor [Candidatus Woesearchaeota archaeon]|nr:NusA-like transcription termination signal-binding factor [Candidatus Woesearchaeota archaeon]HIH31709.1 NusA-like transcription termination signal-binding factor [Candidatus Woesearchaeota archaeon]HIH55013.1 NusA-like transcription termination signal-binding factor [Candidatus Woesearchaeota archaeon]HIJ01021.1 NusA-like transcription termination signal-binding factor [Candidatus Woesearchaeota archaeon]HIJ14737.1 NusA-like transcription termination signal-binding factor [Candidatus Woesea
MMEKQKTVYDLELIKIINLFENITKARVKDAFYMKEVLTFIVFEGDMFKALGKNLVNLHRIEELLKKKVKIVEFNNDLVKFTANLIFPYKVKSITVEDKIVTIIDDDTKTKGLIIGAKAQNLRQYESVVKKYFDIEEIKVV